MNTSSSMVCNKCGNQIAENDPGRWAWYRLETGLGGNLGYFCSASCLTESVLARQQELEQELAEEQDGDSLVPRRDSSAGNEPFQFKAILG